MGGGWGVEGVAAVTVKIPSRTIVVVYIELVHKDPF
jgi:hypothetical protein